MYSQAVILKKNNLTGEGKKIGIIEVIKRNIITNNSLKLYKKIKWNRIA